MVLAFGDCELDLDRYELRRSGVRVPIEPQVFDVLVHLASNAHRVVSKEELLDSVWGDRFVSESALTSRIKAARRAVGDDGRRQAVIATAHGRGYRLVTPVAERQTGRQDGQRTGGLPERASSTALLERDESFATLTDALDAARSGSGRLVFVSGEAGIGKSTLVRSFADQAGPAVPVMVAGCDDLLAPRPLGPVRDLVDQLPGEYRERIGGDPSAAAVAGALAVVGDSTGCVVVLEDLHWADDATLDVIRQLATRVRDLPAVVVVTYREEDVGLAHPLRRLVGTIRGPHVAHVTLAPLGERSVLALAQGSGRDATQVFRVTGGNPLFVTELISSPPGTLPRSIKDAVVSRLGQLAADDAEVVRSISVVPVRVERAVVEVLCGPSDRSLAAAEHRGILAGDATHVWFRHELVRQAVEETLASSERVRMHRQLARYLHERGADPARVIHHATRSDDTELLLAVGPVAARQASAAGAHRQAVQHLAAVLRYAPQLPLDVRAELLTMLTHSLYLLNRFDASLASAVEAVSVSEQLDDPEQLARALVAYERTALWAVGPDAARSAIERALAVLGDDGDLALRATAHADLARAVGELVTVGSVAQANPTAVEHARYALHLAEQLEHPELRGYALMYLGSARLAAGDPEGRTDLQRAIELLSALPRSDLAVRACVNASGAAYRAGDFDEAERYVEHGLRLAKGAEFFSGEYRLALTRASVRLSRGDWGKAEPELRALLARDGEPGIMRPLAQCLLARLLARRGLADEARPILAGAWAAADASGDPRVVGPVAVATVEVSWLSGGDLDPSHTDEARTFASRVGNHTIVAELTRYLEWSGLAAATGDVSGAPEPWASGLRGEWRGAAERWHRRGEPYEEALELLDGDAAACDRGLALLRSLDATGTIAAVTARAPRS